MASSPPASAGDPKAGTMTRSPESSSDLRVRMTAASPEACAGDLRASMTATSPESNGNDLSGGTIGRSGEASANDLNDGKIGTFPEATPILESKRGQCRMVEKSAGNEEEPKDRPSAKLSEIRRSERLRKQPKRKPFSDLTNAFSLSHPLSPSSIPDVTSAKPPSSAISDVAKNKKVQNLWPTSTLRGIPSDSDFVKDQTCSTSHAQQRPIGRESKGKSVVVASTSSCLQLGKTSSMRLKLDSEHVGHHQAKSFSVPLAKPKKKPRFRMPEAVKKPVLPRDFVEKQKAYFAEIDAFELPEEVVSGSELE